MGNTTSDDAAPRLFGEVIDRVQTEMPDWYMPWVQGVVTAGEDMLSAAKQHQVSNRPQGWSRDGSGFKKRASRGGDTLRVQRCGEYWIIERSWRLECGFIKDETLALVFGPMPI